MINRAVLHKFDARQIDRDGGGNGRIIDHVKRDVAIWRTMFEEVGKPDPFPDRYQISSNALQLAIIPRSGKWTAARLD